jgi:hypothetical protein
MPLEELQNLFHTSGYDASLCRCLTWAFKRADFRRRYRREYGIYHEVDRKAVIAAAARAGVEVRFDATIRSVIRSVRKLRRPYGR